MADQLSISILGSGSKGNASIIHNGDEALLVDAGLNCKNLLARMDAIGFDPNMLVGILVTHEHNDHIQGIGTFFKKFNVPVYSNFETARAIHKAHSKVKIAHKVFNTGEEFPLANFKVRSFSISHDAIDPVGYTISHKDFKLGYATDLGDHRPVHIEANLKNCNTIYLESNHNVDMVYACDRPLSLKQRILGNTGHLCNEDAMELLGKILHQDTKNVILGHVSSECNTYGLVQSTIDNYLKKINRDDIERIVSEQKDHTNWLTCK